MSQQIINVGTANNDGTGDPLRTAMIKIQNNFSEIYGTFVTPGSIYVGSNSVSVVANSSGFSNTSDGLLISSANSIFNLNDRVYYSVPTGNTPILPLTGNAYYYISFSNTTAIKLSNTYSGANLDITDTRQDVSFTGTLTSGCTWITSISSNSGIVVGKTLSSNVTSGIQALSNVASVNATTVVMTLTAGASGSANVTQSYGTGELHSITYADRTIVISNTGVSISSNSTVNSTSNSTVVRVANSTYSANLTSGGLNVGANVIVNATAVFVGNSTVYSNIGSVSSFTGATTVSNTLTVSGTATLSNNSVHTGNATFSNTIAVTGNATFSNIVNITGTATFSNTITVTGNATFSNTLNIANLSVTANATVNSYLNVGNTTTNTVIGYNGTNQTLAEFAANANAFNYVLIRNANSGNQSSADISIYNDSWPLTNDKWVDLGITSSTYSNANWTIGPANGAYLYTGNTSLSIGANGTNYVNFFTGGTLAANERIRITSGGNVGISNTAPDATLKVTGTANISGAVVLSNTLTVSTNTFTLGSSNVGAANFANGYSRMPNGLLMQWGLIQANTITGAQTFSTMTGAAFTNIFSMTATSNSTAALIGITALSATGFTLVSNTTANVAVYWTAIGK